jgi:hypothetical protein
MDQVAWSMIEPGWTVVSRGGEDLGRVHELIGDSSADIFNGLAVSPGRMKGSRYVPAERVAAIFEGRVELDLDPEEFEDLDEQTPTPESAQIRADTTDL